MPDDPRWPRASAWLAGAHANDPACRLGVLGAPLRLGSITPGRSDLAPAAVRAVLARLTTYDLECGRDLDRVAVTDTGDLPLAGDTPESAFAPIRDAVSRLLAAAGAVVLLGGDNSITRPGVHAMSRPIGGCGLLTLDAHLDLRDLVPALSNGNPVRALLADGLPGQNIVQIGIQPFANSRAYFDIAREAGITVVTAAEVQSIGLRQAVEGALGHLDARADSIYVDLDLDVLDRAFAPATPGSRPGGLTPSDIRAAARICGAHPKVRVLDLVEIDPQKDIADTTSFAAALCLLSFASGLLGRFLDNPQQPAR